MTMDRLLRLTSGVMLLVVFFFGLVGTNVGFFWKVLVLFMALNQIQSAFTNWCPVISLYRKFGVKECTC